MSLRQFLDNLDAAQLADRLNLALDGATLGIWDWDLRDNSVQFDRRWCEMLGLEHDEIEMALSTWEDRVHPDDIAGCYDDIKAYLNGQTQFYENIHRMRHVEGHWVYILDRGRVSGWDADGNAIRFTGTHFDCTATEEARRTLERQQSVMAALVQDLPTAVAMFDADGRYVASSGQWNDWFGMDETPVGAAAESHALPQPWLDALCPTPNASGSRQQDESHVQARQPGSLEPRTLQWTARPWLVDTSGRTGLILRFDDITQKLARRAVREHRDRLTSLGRMAGGLAHEVNTPLQSLIINAQEALEELDSEHSQLDLIREMLEDSLISARHIAGVVQAMRSVSRDSSTDPTEAVDLSTVTRDVEALTASRLRARGVPLVLDVPDDLPPILGRPAEVSQILLNLLTNAADAVVAHGGGEVTLTAHEDGATVVVEVQDTGPGVPELLQQSIMAPFFTTKPPGEGTGLGLSTSQSLARGLGGTLRLDPEGEQTTFRLTLPRCSA